MSRIKVLLAEEHLITRQGVRRLLEAEQSINIVGEAGDGDEAVKLAMEKKPDVVIMGIAMPKLNGVEATRQIKMLCPTTAVLILSAYDDEEYVFSLINMGVAGYLLKTSTGDELIKAVIAAQKGEPVLNPVITSKIMRHLSPAVNPNSKSNKYGSLSKREQEIIKLAAKGMTNPEIASAVNLGRRTVEYYMRSIFNKMGVGSRTEAVIYGLKKGWFDLDDIC